MKKKVWIGLAVGLLTISTLTGCIEDTEIQKQEKAKVENAMKVFEQTKVPSINKSLERENIRQRILVSNDANTLQWIYISDGGRVFGRFPVKGKVTSGSKRLTNNQSYVQNQGYTDAPDEMGTYGSSSPYVFWFDPAGQIHQWSGVYFVSPVPYKIDEGFGTIDIEIDAEENERAKEYQKQILKTNSNLEQQMEKEEKALQEAQEQANVEGEE